MPELLTIADRLDLSDLAARYAAAVDTRDFEQLRTVFVADCHLDTGSAKRLGVDAVIAAMHGLLRYETTNHVLGQQLIDEDGDGVRGLTYCTAHHLRVSGDDKTGDALRTVTVMHIRYHDRFVSTDAGWRIAERRLQILWTDKRTVT